LEEEDGETRRRRFENDGDWLLIWIHASGQAAYCSMLVALRRVILGLRDFGGRDLSAGEWVFRGMKTGPKWILDLLNEMAQDANEG
jgi:hypothetical protein